MRDRSHTARLLVSCADRPGIVAAVSQFLYGHGANILDAAQHSTEKHATGTRADAARSAGAGGTFFMRMVFHLDGLDLSRDRLERSFQEVVATPFGMDWRIAYADRVKRMAVMVSRYDHALLELLWRWRSGELEAEIPLVISNHDALRPLVEGFGVPFHHLPVTPATKDEQEGRVLELLESRADLVVLARYMQILTPRLVEPFAGRILNIHHSFLPAFAGADPYRQAYERGVKLIGATAHYVTEALDEGPIVEQDVIRVSHRESVADLRRLGREIERRVLARAVAAHLEDRVLLHGNKTVVFE